MSVTLDYNQFQQVSFNVRLLGMRHNIDTPGDEASVINANGKSRMIFGDFRKRGRLSGLYS